MTKASSSSQQNIFGVRPAISPLVRNSWSSTQSKLSPLKLTENASLRDIQAYKVRNTLGEGAVGTVKCVLHTTRTEVYALKSCKYHTTVSILTLHASGELSLPLLSANVKN